MRWMKKGKIGKHFRHDSSSGSEQVEPNVTALIRQMQHQLVFLEKKIDTLISQSSEKPFQGKHFSKSSQAFGRFRRQARGRHDNSSRERNLVQVICSDCKKKCEVPFKPSGDRPVYCKECFAKRKDAGR